MQINAYLFELSLEVNTTYYEKYTCRFFCRNINKLELIHIYLRYFFLNLGIHVPQKNLTVVAGFVVFHFDYATTLCVFIWNYTTGVFILICA